MGGQSLEQKKARQEQEVIEKVLAHVQSGKDIRKGTWGPKEVSYIFVSFSFCSTYPLQSRTTSTKRNAFMMTKGQWPDNLTQLFECLT